MTENLTYDPLNRIASALSQATSGADCWGQNFVPDGLANLNSITVAQCSAGMLSVTVDANNHITSPGYGYDAAGNMTADGSGLTYTFDAENRITAAAGVTYTYDGNGLRVKKSNGTLYWRRLSGDVLAETDLSGNITNEHVFFAGRRIARRDSAGNVFYYFADHLGTPRTLTNAQGNVCYDADFTPYGQEMVHTNTCPQNYKFTGYELDGESGLYYATFRYYNPRLGRFMSSDPLAGTVANPQSLNRYAYALNDPGNLADPLGLQGRARRGDDVPADRGEGDRFGNGFGFVTWDEFDLLNIPVTAVVYGWIPDPNFSPQPGPSGDIPGLGHVTSMILSQEIWGPITVTVGNGFDLFGGNSSWWGTFGSTFINGVLHGVKQPGQSFKACFLQNADQTTLGAFGKLSAAAAALAPSAAAASAQVKNIYQADPEFPGETMSLNMRIAVPAAIQVGVRVAQATGSFSAGAAAGNGTFLTIFNGTLAAGYAGAIAGGAVIGTAIGSAINCR